jgi:hypothetical protein
MVIIIITLLSYVKYFRFNEFYFNIEWWDLCVIYTTDLSHGSPIS